MTEEIRQEKLRLKAQVAAEILLCADEDRRAHLVRLLGFMEQELA